VKRLNHKKKFSYL